MKRSLGLLFLVQGIFAAVAGAQSVTITFSGAVSSTPAPSTWVLMGIGLLFAFLVFRKAHSLPGGRATAAILMLIGIAAYEVFTGNTVASKAIAIPGNTVQESITGGTILTANNLDNSGATQEQWVNNTGSTITVTSVTPDQFDTLGTPFSSPQCAQNLVVAPGNSCYTLLLSNLEE
jgi:hypothetical protein